MRRACKIVAGAFLLLYLAALGLFAISTFGLFGAGRDPLSAVFLIPFDLPWIPLIDPFPDALQPWLAAGAPLLNLIGLWLICRAFRADQSARRP